MKRALLFFLSCLVAFGSFAQPTQPILQLETGMHLGMINRISSDREGRYLLTCSDDKTARLWDAASGRLLRTLRIPMAAGNEGKIYACALSPDGRYAAIGGWTAYAWDSKCCIYILDAQTGAFIKKLKNLESSVLDLEFSPNGEWLAAGLAGSAGVQVFQTRSWTSYTAMKGYGGDVYGLSFSGNDVLASTCEDGHVRIYKDFTLQQDIANIGEEQRAICFSPDGKTLAVAGQEVPTVTLLDARTGRIIERHTNKDVEQDRKFTALAFSQDGSQLWAGGSPTAWNATTERWQRFLRSWSNGGRGSFTDHPIFSNIVVDIKPFPDGSMAAASAYPELARVKANGEVRWEHRAPTSSFGSSDRSHFRLNQDGTQMGITPFKEEAISIDIRNRTITEKESLHPGYSDRNGGTVVESWLNSTTGRFNALLFSSFLDRGESSRSVDVEDDGSAVIGADWSLLRVSKEGRTIWKVDVPEVPWCVKISGNGKVVAVAHGDGIIRWYSMADGKELLTLYMSPDHHRWIYYTPSGYYDASPGSEDLLGWHMNNGPDAAPNFVPLSRYRETYYRPDIIDAILETYDEPRAVALANSRSSRTAQTVASVRDKRPPVVTILSPATGSTVRSETVRIEYSISTPDDAPVKSVKVLVNGRPVALERGIQKTASNKASVNIAIPATGESTITLLAESDNGLSPEANLFLRYEAPAQQADAFVRKPKLYVLAIGISDYQNAEYKLNYADKDADAFVAGVTSQKDKLYSDVVVRKLTNKDATRDAIQDGLEWIQQQTSQGDIAMIFYAGHGVNDNNGVFYMLPVAADVNRMRSTCLNFEELKQTVSSIAGKVVVFIDACHSGNVMGSSQRRGGTDINAIVNELSSTQNGAITFTSSTGKEFSLEDPSWKHGAFTMALLEGLSGKAGIAGKGKITVKSLDAYISERVKEITRGQQHPTSVVPPNVPDFTIAVF